jgi:hypothetical protein
MNTEAPDMIQQSESKHRIPWLIHGLSMSQNSLQMTSTISINKQGKMIINLAGDVMIG